ncbi:ANE_G0043220.mRNA.1.CDS.1 [Saccharomyces cerevisiae]|nr:ANE_G0043220.mRNA.1.CDS.1 [Saccharomyces cerevisiae]CAI6849923.1 ANE_G0043220.mRNA.1.CDS.1 [Saccharomyces cerevisiae]
MSYSFLDFGLTKLNIFSSMVLTYTSAQRECSHNTDYARGCQKDVRALCLLGWPESIVSEDSLGSTAVERMLRNDEENTKNTWKTSSHILGTL